MAHCTGQTALGTHNEEVSSHRWVGGIWKRHEVCDFPVLAEIAGPSRRAAVHAKIYQGANVLPLCKVICVNAVQKGCGCNVSYASGDDAEEDVVRVEPERFCHFGPGAHERVSPSCDIQSARLAGEDGIASKLLPRLAMVE